MASATPTTPDKTPPPENHYFRRRRTAAVVAVKPKTRSEPPVYEEMRCGSWLGSEEEKEETRAAVAAGPGGRVHTSSFGRCDRRCCEVSSLLHGGFEAMVINLSGCQTVTVSICVSFYWFLCAGQFLLSRRRIFSHASCLGGTQGGLVGTIPRTPDRGQPSVARAMDAFIVSPALALFPGSVFSARGRKLTEAHGENQTNMVRSTRGRWMNHHKDSGVSWGEFWCSLQCA